jgi:small nuclear ribonucleoprotein (snRNP)-like protein
MEKEEFQKKYNNSILVCCTEASIKKVLNICYLMDLTASKSKQITAILIGEQTAKSPLFHVEQFLNDFYKEMQGRGEKETKMFEQRMNNAIYKLKQKYGDTYIIKGTDMGTVIQFIQELNMEVVQEEMDDVIYIKGERCDKPYIKNSTRQFIADLMSNMIDVLNPFINKETMIEIKESCNAEYLINEAEFYITSTFTTPLQKEYDKQRKVLSIGFGNKKIIMVDEEDFHVFLKAFYYLYKCNEWIKKDDEKNKEQPKEPVFNKGNKIIYTIKDSNGNTYPVNRLSERVYESKEHKTLFITNEEGTVTGIYQEK